MSTHKDLYNELMEKYTGKGGEKSSTNQSSGHQSTGAGNTGSEHKRMYQDLMKKYSQEVNDVYINSFFRDAKSIFGKYSDQVDYKTGRGIYDANMSALDDLSTRGRIISRHFEKNADRYENQSQLQSDTEGILSNLKQYGSYLKEQQAFFSQWNTEEDYLAWKDYDEKSKFDLDKGRREIEELERQRGALMKPDTRPATTYLTGGSGTQTIPYGAAPQAPSEEESKAAELGRQISRKKQYLNQAKHIQNGITLSSVTDNADFQAYSGADTTNTDPTYRWINDEQYRTDVRNNIWQANASGLAAEAAGGQEQAKRWLAANGNPDERSLNGSSLDQMTPDEVAIYNYHYAKGGAEQAQKYLDAIGDSLNQRKAQQIYAGLEGKTLEELAFGVQAGIDQFARGTAGLFSDKELPVSAVQYASGMVREDLKDRSIPLWYNFKEGKWEDKVFGASAGQIAYDTATTMSNMAPSVLTSMAVGVINPGAGAAAGNALMFASSAGSAYQEALDLGYDKGQARAYSTLVGASEAGLQYLLGGISKLGGKMSGNALNKMLDGVDNAFARTALKLGGNMLSEGMEEGLQEVLTPLFKNMTLHADEDINWSEVAYSTLLGALTAGVMEGPTTISGEVGTYKTGKALQGADISVERLAEIGKTFAADTVAHQLAGRVDENTGAYTMGRLFHEIGATLTEQNVSEITETLVEKGMDQKTARKNAEVMALVVEGRELTEQQAAVIEANEVLAEAVITTIVDPDAAWTQRTKGYHEALGALAREKAATAEESSDAPVEEAEKPVKPLAEARDDDGDFAASESGRAEFDGKPVDIRGIADTRGDMTLALEDGRTVKASEVLYASEGEALVYEAVASLGAPADIGNILVKNYREGAENVEAEDYAMGMALAFNHGRLNLPKAQITDNPYIAKLTEVQRNSAYVLGQRFGGKQVATQQAIARRARFGQRFRQMGQPLTGSVHYDGDVRTLNVRQRASVAALEKVADALGVQIHLFESYENSEGQRVYKAANGEEVSAPNGWYDTKTGDIGIDIHAGISGEDTMLFTAAHELTHFIKQWSPAKFKVLANFLMEQYGKKGISVEELIEQQQAKALRSGRELSFDEAFEELVADSMEAMLADGNIVEKLAKLKARDRNLLEKLCDGIRELVEKIREVYAGLKPDSREGRYVAEMKDSIERFQELFTEALEDAGQNFQAAKQAEAAASTQQNVESAATMQREAAPEPGQGEAEITETDWSDFDEDSVEFSRRDNEKTAREGGSVKWSLRETTDGRMVAVIDSDILAGISPENWDRPTRRIAQNAAKEALAKFDKGIAVSGTTIKVNRITRREYAKSDYTDMLGRKNPEVFADKMRAAANVDDVVLAAVGWKRDGELKYPRNDFVGFDRGRTLIAASTNRYEAEVVVGVTASGEMVLYDLVDIEPSAFEVKESAPPTTATTKESIGDIQGGTDKASVAWNADGVNTKFSLRQPVEETKTLIAMHNLTADKLEKAIELGGFPMPSIAVTRADIPHTNFGEITLVMDKRTVDPKADRRNDVFSADAWTPTFPRTEYEADSEVEDRVRRTLQELERKIAPQFQGNLRRVMYGLEDLLNSYDGEENLIAHVLENDGLKAVYLESKGQHIDEVHVEQEVPKRYNQAAQDKYEAIIAALGTRDPAQIGTMPLKDIRDNYGAELEKIVPGISKTSLRLSRFMQQVIDYLMDDGSGPATEMVVDHAATKQAVEDALDREGYEAWVRELFSGIEGDKGVYNGKERFTPSGRSRSFQQTHLPVTLDNIVKAMAAQNGGNTKNVSGFNGVKTLRAGTAQRFKSIQGMHELEGRLQNLNEEEQAALTDGLQHRLYELIDEIDRETGRRGGDNSLIRFDIIGQIITEASETGRYNVADIQRVFRENHHEIGDELAMKVKELLFDVSQMPVNLFEAKPRRAVRFDEVMAAVVPSGTSESLRAKLAENGVQVVEYESGNPQDRLEKVNGVEGAKFSERDPAAQKLNRALEKENAAQAKEIEYLRELVKLQGKVTNGTKFTRTSVRTLAKNLMQEAGAKGDYLELSEMLNGVYEYIAGLDDPAVAPDWEDIAQRTGKAAQWLMDHVEVKQERGEYADDIIKELRTMRISLNEGQMAEVTSRYGSYNDFRKANFGSFVLSKDGTPLDVAWQDLADRYPGTFDADVGDADMPLKLAEIVEGLRDTDLAAAEFEAMRDDLTAQMQRAVYDGYWKVSTLRTVADVWQKRVNTLKESHAKSMGELQKARQEIRDVEQKHREALRQLRRESRAVVKSAQAETAQRYRDARRKATEGRHKTAERRKIGRTVKELEKLLLKGDKKKHVKEGMRNFVEEALASATVLFADTYSDEELVMNGIGTELTPEENQLMDKTRHLLGQKKDLLSDSAIAAESEAVNAGDTSGFEKRMKQVEKLNRQIGANLSKLHAVLVRERSRLNKATVGAVLANLSAAYRSLGQSDDLYIRGAAREEVWQHLDSLAETIGGATSRDLTLEQLKDVNKAFQMVLHTVRSANKLFAEGQKENLVDVVKAAIREITSNGRNSRLGVKLVEELKKFGFNNLKPVYFFEHLNSRVMRGLYKGLLNGQSQWAKDVDEARAYFRRAADRAGFDKWDMEKIHTFQAASGDEFRLNLQQMMSLYAYSRREQARDHIRKGGIVIDSDTDIQEVVEIGGKLKVKLKGKSTDATAYNIDDVTLGEIIGKLTKEQKTFVEEMQNYLSDTMGGKGNEVSMTLYGVKLFTEQNYLPIRSAHQYMVRAKEQAEQTGKVKNAGFTKSTVAHASNPVVLTPFMDLWSDHVDEMSLYHSMALPLEDLHRVYTFSQTGDGGKGSQSVTAAIENAFGSQATGYIDQLMKDLNGGARVDSTTGIINKNVALFKKGSTFLSASVVIQQPSAIVRATALVDSKYFQWAKLPAKWALDLTARRKQHDRLWAECKQYAPIALIKEMGYFDTSVGRTTRDFIQAKEYSGWSEKARGMIHDSGYRDEVFSRAPALADELAWCSIWEAVKREQHDKHPKLRVGSEEFLKLCGERFTEVIDRTQVYDSVLARSANMRSKDTGMKMATSFMAEPTVSANMVADAILRGKRGDKKAARRAVASVISSGILNAMLYSLVAAARDDDEDKEYWEKYLGSVTGEVFEVINPATYLPFARDVWSLIQGYDVERSDMALVADLVNAIRSFGSENKSGPQKVESFVSVTGKLFGLPVGNIWRDARALYNVFGDAVDGQGSTAAGIGYAVMENLPFGKAASNAQQLYEARIGGNAEHEERVAARYKDASDVRSALRKALRENDSRIHEAAVAWNEGRMDDYMAIAKKIIAEKHFHQDDVVAAVQTEAKSLLPDEESTESAARHKGLFTAAAFAVAAADNDGAMMKAIREDLVQTGMSNGKSREEAEKSVNSSIKSEVKECFEGGILDGSRAAQVLAGYCGMEKMEAEEQVTEWLFEKEHGYKWSERMDRFAELCADGSQEVERIRQDIIAAAVAGGQSREDAEKDFQSDFRSALGDLYEAEGVSDKQAVSLLEKYGGKTAEGALTTVRYWEFRRDNPGVYADDSWIDKYYSEIQSSGMTIEVYVGYREQVKAITGTGKKEGRMAVIDSLPISKAQKDALYYAEGWAKSRIGEAPWH